MARMVGRANTRAAAMSAQFEMNLVGISPYPRFELGEVDAQMRFGRV